MNNFFDESDIIKVFKGFKKTNTPGPDNNGGI